MKSFKEFLIEEQKSGTDKEYDAFLEKKAKEWGYDSVGDIPDEKRDDFFDEVEKEWEADDE